MIIHNNNTFQFKVTHDQTFNNVYELYSIATCPGERQLFSAYLKP